MRSSDRLRSILVAVMAVAQVVASPLTTLAVGPSSNTGAISDANQSPVTPAGYAFAIWGLIYLGCLALAVYQLRPGQRGREVHRRTGWWLVLAFTASTIWVPIFGLRVIWLSQIVIVGLVAALAVASWRFSRLGPAETNAERWLLRLPVTVYLGWATLACTVGFATTFRSLGMPADAGWVRVVSLGLLVLATALSLVVVAKWSAIAGFAFTACWALVAVAVASSVPAVRVTALVALVVVLGAATVRVTRSRQPREILLG